MAQYDISNTSGIGRPCRVFDANNKEILDILWCDTETGEVERYVLNDGLFVINEFKEVETMHETFDAPLRIEWIKK